VSERVALETTVFVHGLPRDEAGSTLERMEAAIVDAGAVPVLVGGVGGRATAGIGRQGLDVLLGAERVEKVNSANLGVVLARGSHGATTVSATAEIGASAGVRVLATGGIGGVHRDAGRRLDISADLVAISRLPVAVVASGAKSILDVVATRELLETLGVPVVGFGTDEFPAFYTRSVPGERVGLDARFDDAAELAGFVRSELARTGRGMVIADPVPEASEIDPERLARWMKRAERETRGDGARGAALTPTLLSRLHEASGGETVRANIELLVANASLAGRIAAGL